MQRMLKYKHACIFILFLCWPFASLATDQMTLKSHGITTFGELRYNKDFQHFNYANPKAPKGGQITYAVQGSFNSLNPFILKGTAVANANSLFDTLMVSSKDEASSAYGLIAETIEYPEDRSWIIFNLRDEAKWHDGKTITASDVVFSFEALKTKGHPFYRAYYQDVQKAEALAEKRVKFTFNPERPNRELVFIIGQLPILPKHYYEKHEFAESTLTPPLGSGPYTISHVDAGKSITYERVKDYWAADLPVNKGKYNFDTIRYDYYRDTTVLIEALKAGKYDIRQENISRLWATAYNIDDVKTGRLKKEKILHTIPSGMQAFILNIRRPQLQNAKTREALNYAFDFEWENKQLFYGAYTRTDNYFENSEFASSGLPTGEELALLEPYRNQLPPRLFTDVFALPKTDGSGPSIRPHLRTAKKLLKEAGWKIEKGLLVDSKTNKPFTLEFLIDDTTFERVIAPMIQNLKKLGIQANIRLIDKAQYQQRVQSFDYDVILESFGQSASPGNEQMNYWHSSRADTPGSRNLIGIKNPVVDALVEKLISAQTKEDLITVTRALDRVLLWHFYVIPNWHSQSFRMLYWNKFSRPEVTPTYGLGLDTWWYDETKAAELEASKP